MDFEETIMTFDDTSRKEFSENEISAKLKCIKDKTAEIEYEILAFDISEHFHHEINNSEGNWGVFYSSLFTLPDEKGNYIEYPSIKQIRPEIIDYWEGRIDDTKNPILTARYSGLVCDFKYEITKNIPSNHICRIHINALIDVAVHNYHKSSMNIIFKLKRALKLSIKLKDEDLIEKVKAAIISYEEVNSKDSKRGTWGYSFDELIDNKKIHLTNDEEEKLVGNLEIKLKKSVSLKDSTENKPWCAKSAGVRLASYYRKKSKTNEVERVLNLIASSFEFSIIDKSAIVSTSILEEIYYLYKSYDFFEKAKDFLKRIEELKSKVNSEMKVVKTTSKIELESIKPFIDELSSLEIKEIFGRIAFDFIQPYEDIRNQLAENVTKSPMLYLFKRSLIDDTGRVVASINSVEDELEGHIVLQLSENLYNASPYLRIIIEQLIKKDKIKIENIIEVLLSKPFINNDIIGIYERGLKSYFSEDYIIFIHLLIPQIENTFRNILELLGGCSFKTIRNGGYQLKTFEQVLKDPNFHDFFGKDIINYLRVIFTDQRGWNLRNKVCHGIFPLSSMQNVTADRIFQVLMILLSIEENHDFVIKKGV
jgi:hypothetical protein